MVAQHSVKSRTVDPLKTLGAHVSETVVTITPEMAVRLLERNPQNRTIRDYRVLEYAGAMESGEWEANGEPIILDENGNILDGQHRLNAIVVLNAPVSCVVIHGVRPNTRTTIDKGAARTPGDVLRIEGYANSNQLSATAAWLYRYKMTGFDSTVPPKKRMTSDKMLDLIKASPGIEESVRHGSHFSFRTAPLTASVVGFLHYVFSQVDKSSRPDADTFFDSLDTGAGLALDSPILILRNRLIANKAAKLRMNQIEEIALTIKAWNAWREGRVIRSLRWRTGGNRNESFPRPV